MRAHTRFQYCQTPTDGGNYSEMKTHLLDPERKKALRRLNHNSELLLYAFVVLCVCILNTCGTPSKLIVKNS